MQCVPCARIGFRNKTTDENGTNKKNARIIIINEENWIIREEWKLQLKGIHVEQNYTQRQRPINGKKPENEKKKQFRRRRIDFK